MPKLISAVRRSGRETLSERTLAKAKFIYAFARRAQSINYISTLTRTAMRTRPYAALFLALLLPLDIFAAVSLSLKDGDVVAFVGGSDVAAAQHTGHLDSLLAAKYANVHFRNFGWEGDTVFARPRDFNFPPLVEHLRKAGANVVILQFGRAEALNPHGSLPNFREAYHDLLTEVQLVTARVFLVIPPPYENPGGLLPNLATKNSTLEEYASAIREIGKEAMLPIIDLFSELTKPDHSKGVMLTEDGLQFTGHGHAFLAVAFARQIGLDQQVHAAGSPSAEGAWKNPGYEQLRQLVIIRNQLWFNYWRPQNWAFLGGDRTEQPSSRDHRDPKVRWFPAEIEKFKMLINAKEEQIRELVKELSQ
jgi:hypothetical protein